jgi:hypothetical protein
MPPKHPPSLLAAVRGLRGDPHHSPRISPGSAFKTSRGPHSFRRDCEVGPSPQPNEKREHQPKLGPRCSWTLAFFWWLRWVLLISVVFYISSVRMSHRSAVSTWHRHDLQRKCDIAHKIPLDAGTSSTLPMWLAVDGDTDLVFLMSVLVTILFSVSLLNVIFAYSNSAELGTGDEKVRTSLILTFYFNRNTRGLLVASSSLLVVLLVIAIVHVADTHNADAWEIPACAQELDSAAVHAGFGTFWLVPVVLLLVFGIDLWSYWSVRQIITPN